MDISKKVVIPKNMIPELQMRVQRSKNFYPLIRAFRRLAYHQGWNIEEIKEFVEIFKNTEYQRQLIGQVMEIED